MSLARYDADERSICTYARVPRQPHDLYAPQFFMGRQRSPLPEKPEESEALAVIDLTFGDRALIFEVPSDSTFRRVIILRTP